MHKKLLPPSMRNSHLVLLPKTPQSGPIPSTSDFRPISLLSSDYKILARILAHRLETALSPVVGPHQTCGFKGRTINSNLHWMRTACEAGELGLAPLAVLQLDLRKAFDRVQRPFLFTLLRHCGVGDAMMEWIQICYTQITTSIIVNGQVGTPIMVQNSVRQGCPMSPLLFALYLEPLCRMVAASTKIEGLVMGGRELRVLAYADDVALICTTAAQAGEVLRLAHRFCGFSGAELNLEKSEGAWLGCWERKSRKCFNMRWSDRVETYLGVKIGVGQAVAPRWKAKVDAAEWKLHPWRNRNISIYARSLLCNMVAYPAILYAARITTIDAGSIQRLHRSWSVFVWRSQ